MAKDKKSFSKGSGGMCMVYCLGFIGAVVYFIQIANGFWPIVLAILKAAVWPALLVYKLLQFLGV